MSMSTEALSPGIGPRVTWVLSFKAGQGVGPGLPRPYSATGPHLAAGPTLLMQVFRTRLQVGKSRLIASESESVKGQ